MIQRVAGCNFSKASSEPMDLSQGKSHSQSLRSAPNLSSITGVVRRVLPKLFRFKEWLLLPFRQL